MFDLNAGWNLSFAGCGFLGIYHVGVSSCLLEKAPFLVHGATKLYGASAGALTASVLASQACIAKCCEDVIEVAKEARRRNLGPLHPSFNLVKVLKSGLDRDLPSDAHVQASGRLCVSLTRVSDGENILVTQFNTKDELIQLLHPIYCGLIPPSYRGVRYVDGGISNNLPQADQKNTISISPFSGESDICPRDNSSSFHELRFTNTSIQMNLGNMYRLSRALFPPEPKVMAEMCQSGYQDALRFLEDNNLLMVAQPSPGPSVADAPPGCCCCAQTESTREWVLRRLRLLRKQHWWMDEKLHLPSNIKKVFCEACQDKAGLYSKVSGMLPMRVASYMLLPYTLPVQSAVSVAQRFLEWIPDVPADARWLFGVVGDVYRQAWRGAPPGDYSDPSLRKCLTAPPLTTEPQRPLDLDTLPALSSLDLHRTYWEIPKTSPASSPHVPPSSPQQVRFFLGSQEDAPAKKVIVF
uniref:triacylglycerol lipase n=1 Tax=Neogobius melanostomus TaxID=47308 RepID=A0A8C6UCC4_9GOBI